MAWPMPTVRHFLACQRFVSDLAVRDFSLINVIYQLRPPAGVSYPFLLRELHLLVQFADGQGEFDISIELVRLDDELVVFRLDPVRLALTDRLRVYNFHRVRTQVPIERAGQHEFRLYCELIRHPDGTARHGSQLLGVEPLRME